MDEVSVHVCLMIYISLVVQQTLMPSLKTEESGQQVSHLDTAHQFAKYRSWK